MPLPCVILAVAVAGLLARMKPTAVTLAATVLATLAVVQLSRSSSDGPPRSQGARPASILLTWDGGR